MGFFWKVSLGQVVRTCGCFVHTVCVYSCMLQANSRAGWRDNSTRGHSHTTCGCWQKHSDPPLSLTGFLILQHVCLCVRGCVRELNVRACANVRLMHRSHGTARGERESWSSNILLDPLLFWNEEDTIFIIVCSGHDPSSGCEAKQSGATPESAMCVSANERKNEPARKTHLYMK